MRATLDELMEARNPSIAALNTNQQDLETPIADQQSGGLKLGWFKGVYIKCLLNIWGVMLFLRLTWVVGHAGLIQGLMIITLANIVTLITTISMSAVSTNGKIKGGGIYYMLSRALGPEFGGAIGLMITLANAIAVSMYVIGFCESLLDMLTLYLPDFNGIVDSSAIDRFNDIRLIGSITMVAILGLAIVGMDWISRVEIGLLAILIISQVDFVIGSFLPPTDQNKADGFIGFNADLLETNLWSDYQKDEKTGDMTSFFKVFAVFFPAVTGIMAGANFSGDLKNPGMAIPKGTLAAIGTTYLSYFGYCFIIAGCSLRHASGILDEVHFSENILNATYIEEHNITLQFDDCLG